MPNLPLGNSARKREGTWTPSLPLVNVISEQSEANAYGGVDHIQRPGLAPFTTAGTGAIRGIYRLAGSFLGDFFVASGLQWYRVTGLGVATLLGTLTGTDLVIQAASQTRIIAAAGGIARSYSGGAVTTVVMPDGRIVFSVAHLNGYFILTEFNSARFYWIDPGQTDPDGLSFATTESSPGAILKVERVGDELWFFKEEGVEVWIPTGDPDLPFQRVAGRNYEKGCRARDTVCRFDNAVAWVGNDGVVYRADNSPQRISTHTVEEQIRLSALGLLAAFSYTVDGHTMYVLRMEQGSWAYDASTQLWSQFMSYEREQWRVQVGDFDEESPVVGDDITGQLYRLDATRPNDNGDPLTRIVTGGVAVAGAPVRWNNIELYAQTGTAADPNLVPRVRISWSDDGGETYEDWEDTDLYQQGRYGEPIRINRCGAARMPGRIVKFQVTDDVVWTAQGASFNAPNR